MFKPANVLIPQHTNVMKKYGIIAEKLSEIAGGTESGFSCSFITRNHFMARID